MLRVMLSMQSTIVNLVTIEAERRFLMSLRVHETERYPSAIATTCPAWMLHEILSTSWSGACKA